MKSGMGKGSHNGIGVSILQDSPMLYTLACLARRTAPVCIYLYQTSPYSKLADLPGWLSVTPLWLILPLAGIKQTSGCEIPRISLSASPQELMVDNVFCKNLVIAQQSSFHRSKGRNQTHSRSESTIVHYLDSGMSRVLLNKFRCRKHIRPVRLYTMS